MKNNREQWLIKATKELDKRVFKPAFRELGHDLVVPEDVKVSCGFPPSGARGRRSKTIGVCFPRESSTSNVNEIFISPILDDSIKVLDVLAHELIHAIDNCVNGHRGIFVEIARKIGLVGKPTATSAGDELKEKLEAIVNVIGEYPHKEVKLSTKKQSTRNIKVKCSNGGCDWTFRQSQKQINLIEENHCLSCGEDDVLIYQTEDKEWIKVGESEYE